MTNRVIHTNAFELGRNIEKQSRAIVEPLLDEATNGKFVYTDKGRLAVEFQKKYGDVLIQEKKSNGMWTVEIKAEKSPSPNFFLEHWSNGKWLTTGWMFTLQADLLFYHFLDSDELYIMKLPHLQRWFHFGEGFNKSEPCLYRPGCERFPLKRQKKYDQLNDTWGRCVPIEVVRKEVGLKKFNPLGLFGMEQAA